MIVLGTCSEDCRFGYNGMFYFYITCHFSFPFFLGFLILNHPTANFRRLIKPTIAFHYSLEFPLSLTSHQTRLQSYWGSPLQTFVFTSAVFFSIPLFSHSNYFNLNSQQILSAKLSINFNSLKLFLEWLSFLVSPFYLQQLLSLMVIFFPIYFHDDLYFSFAQIFNFFCARLSSLYLL